MGLEVALIAGAIAAGTQVYASREQARDAKGARREQAYQASRQQAQLDETQKANDATAAARLARMRQRAALSGGNESTIATSPMGLSATQTPTTGPQPLKKLGA